eukprot:7082584-Prorocentrum_lima.AAC.1
MCIRDRGLGFDSSAGVPHETVLCPRRSPGGASAWPRLRPEVPQLGRVSASPPRARLRLGLGFASHFP